MHHAVIDRWSRQSSFLHSRDARAKALATLAVLVSVATLPTRPFAPLAAFGAVLGAGILLARLPPAGLVCRSAVVLPFTVAFALMTWLSGDPAKAVSLAVKSYLSAVAVLLLVATTPLAALVSGLESLGIPRAIGLVVQFVYRYLFVISEQAQHMRVAASCRSGAGPRARRFRAAAGALAVLFAKSYQRAEGIHRAMVVRGFQGRFPVAAQPRFGVTDALFLLAAACLAAAIRLGARPA